MTSGRKANTDVGPPVLRDAGEADFTAILALNAAVVASTSAMDADRLRLLHAMAAYHRVATIDGDIAAFLLAMHHGVAYDSENYRWFAARYPRFAYVDRIVVNAVHAGAGIGARLYRDLFAHARAHGLPIVACEYNVDPPNPASRAFHDRFGFVEVGTQRVAGGSKLVSLQVASVRENIAP